MPESAAFAWGCLHPCQNYGVYKLFAQRLVLGSVFRFGSEPIWKWLNLVARPVHYRPTCAYFEVLSMQLEMCSKPWSYISWYAWSISVWVGVSCVTRTCARQSLVGIQAKRRFGYWSSAPCFSLTLYWSLICTSCLNVHRFVLFISHSERKPTEHDNEDGAPEGAEGQKQSGKTKKKVSLLQILWCSGFYTRQVSKIAIP